MSEVVRSRADAYAEWARSGADISFEPTLTTLLELLPPAPLHILDVGCGQGRVGRELTQRGYEVVGVDSDSRMVELASQRHSAILAEAAQLPFGDASFASVVSIHALMEIEDAQGAVNEIARVLGPGGVAVIIIEHPFASATKVERYSEEAPYSWGVRHEGVDIRLGGIHRPLETYTSLFEEAGLSLEALREISVGAWDPMSLAVRARSRLD